MSTDPVIRLAQLKIIKASADLEVTLSNAKPSGPLIEIYRRFRDRAAEALTALAFIKAEDTEGIRTLQNEVKRYDEFVNDVRTIVAEGMTYDADMKQEEREEMLDVLTTTPEGQRQAIELGLIDLEQEDA